MLHHTNCLGPGYVLSLRGNPTRSKEVNDIIKAVKKKETRRQRKNSKADRPMEKEENTQKINILQRFNNIGRKYRWQMMIQLMCHLIG